MKGNIMDKSELINYIYTKIDEVPVFSYDGLYNKKLPNEHRYIFYELKSIIDDFLNGYVENRFLTLSGLRGLGKTTVVFQIYDYLLNEKKIPQERILYVSNEELNFLGNNLYELIDMFIREIHESAPVFLKSKLFIFVDEAHYDKNWSLIGKIFYDKTPNIFFIFTGSSALSLDINVDAVRRIKREIVFPLKTGSFSL
jgi:predicted AAA+ superfamily ATPase